MLKRTPSLTEQAKAHIKQRIINDEFEAGRIPSETELATELGVSRTTIRDALSRLELEGVIFRKQGAGTFVNEPGLQIKTRLEEIWAYEAMLQAHGYNTAVELPSVTEQPASAELAADLGLEPNEPVLKIEKLIFANTLPVILVDNYLPLKLIQQSYTQQDCLNPVYEFLAEFCQQHLTYYLSEIVPLNATDRMEQMLNIPVTQAMICFEEIGYNQDNVPILKAYSHFHDDVLRFRLIRRETA